LGEETIRIANTYEMRYGPEPHDVVYYVILADRENISKEDDPLILPGESRSFKKKLCAMTKILHKHFWPSVVGHGKHMDKYFDNINEPNYAMVKQANFKFHDG
jgi:hypothetical protein